jgi:hypothetical protein
MIVDVHAHLLNTHALNVAGPPGAAFGFGARPSVPDRRGHARPSLGGRARACVA